MRHYYFDTYVTLSLSKCNNQGFDGLNLTNPNMVLQGVKVE